MNSESESGTYMGFLWFNHNNPQNESGPNRVLSSCQPFETVSITRKARIGMVG